MTDCDEIEIGSVYFLNVNLYPEIISGEGFYQTGEGRHGEVTLFAFEDLPGNLDLYLTDRAWDSAANAFVNNDVEQEGTVVYTTPSSGVPSGLAFGMGNNTLVEDTGGLDWMDVGTNSSFWFHLGLDGDQVFLYCLGADGSQRPLAGFSYGGPFLPEAPADTDYGTATSGAPGYFYEPTPNTSEFRAQTPGLLVMRPKEECFNRIFWHWQFESPSSGVMQFNDLQNALSDDTHWVGTSPMQGNNICRAAAPQANSQPYLSTVLGVILLIWLLAAV